jgi:hypothetical protein
MSETKSVSGELIYQSPRGTVTIKYWMEAAAQIDGDPPADLDAFFPQLLAPVQIVQFGDIQAVYQTSQYALFGGTGWTNQGGGRDLRYVGTLEDCRRLFERQREGPPPLQWAHIAELSPVGWGVIEEWRLGEEGLRGVEAWRKA